MNQIPLKDVTPNKPSPGAKQSQTIELYAEREHIYTRAYTGRFRNLRVAAGYLMLGMFFIFPWLNWDGHQLVHFDLPNRQFHIFGATFWPQDFALLSWLLIILAFLLFFVTVFAGRVWCGYACPQFVWTWLFMWGERVTEGDRNQRIKLDRAPWSGNKILRKTAKHSLWLVIAIASAVTFVGYFTPIRELVPAITQVDLGPWESWWLLFFAVATYGNAGFLREQVCIYMCPYARFQSVMFDQDTLVISYDEKRGEQRGSRKKNADYRAQGLGDCIDCRRCVDVCPVGIDIRDGLQYECVACGACVDACDDMMGRMDYPKGLIRYTTEHNLSGQKTHILRPRLVGYFVALMVMIGAFGWAVMDRVPLELDIIRDRNQLYGETPSGLIENTYTLKLANMDRVPHRFRIAVSGLEGLQFAGAEEIDIAAGELRNHPIRLQVDPKRLSKPNYQIRFQVQAADAPTLRVEEDSRFLGPTPR